MVTYEPLLPGNAPLISKMFLSDKILTISRLRTLTRSPPIRPAMRMPFNTREGNEEAPIDPGARSRLCCPCVRRPTPPKLWRRTTP